MLKLTITERTFHFKQPAGTSRGVYTTRRSWFVTATDTNHPEVTGVGECAPLPKLSCDDLPDYAVVLRTMCDKVEQEGKLDLGGALRHFPSMLFGLETALIRLRTASDIIFDTPFTRGEMGIPINGLVWMGDYEQMLHRMEEKMERGFRCVKIKIGAIDFEKELDLVSRVRDRFTKEDIQLRLDANGAFTPGEVMDVLQRLAKYNIHSIEQPIRQGQWGEMADVCAKSPIPIALDEELIGVNDRQEKERLLEQIKPQYIILKPSLHGGVAGTTEWVNLARERGIGSWMTSALESNVGLSAIAQLAAQLYGCPPTMPQGLGTGQLFTDNIDRPLKVVGDQLFYTKEGT
ncbi:MAG: o-succinylbenzoate synthase [Prevotella sp.]|nr:o-succinylbenzoate synthase [Prevotella sp.]